MIKTHGSSSLAQARRAIIKIHHREIQIVRNERNLLPDEDRFGQIQLQVRRYDRRVTHREEHLSQIALQILPRRPVLRRPQRYIKVGQAALEIGVRVKNKKKEKEEEEIGIKKRERQYETIGNY